MTMIKYTLPFLFFSASALAFEPAPSALKQHDKKPEKTRYLIQFKHSLASQASPLVSGEQQIYNLQGTTKRLLNKQNTIAAELSSTAIQQLKNDPNILFIEKDPVRNLAHKGYSGYGIPMVQAPLVADTASSNQKICVIDTGYDSRHEDLPNGANITGEVLDVTGGKRNLGNWFEDTYGHGTHITGTLAALGNNIGLEGILPNGTLNIHHVKVVDNAGYWRVYGSDIIASLNACESAGATVVNMSLAGWEMSELEETALQDAYDAGMLLVGAGGNHGTAKYAYPASYKSVISVGAIDSAKDAWMFTQQNDQIELVAPGVEVNSTLPNNKYGKWDGTSVAAPHVSGVAALVWSHFPECSAYQIRDALTQSAQDLGNIGRDDVYGFGLVQAKAAVDWINTNGCPVSNPVRQTCKEIMDNGESNGSGVYTIDLDNGGPLPEFDVYCDMENLGGGWTLLAYHADNLSARTPRENLTGDQYGVLPDAKWQALRDTMTTGLMFVDEYKKVTYLNESKVRGGRCATPYSSTNDTLVTGGSGKSKNKMVWWDEKDCTETGVDYSLALMYLNSQAGGSNRGASLWQYSSTKFDIWPYSNAGTSMNEQNQLYYFIK